MSLDVYLYDDKSTTQPVNSGIFIRENGQTKEISREEWEEKFPGREPIVLQEVDEDDAYCFHANITHNLGKMAEKAGIYKVLWRPEEAGCFLAEQLVVPLETGLRQLKDDPEYFAQFNPKNGWGNYGVLVDFVSSYLRACKAYPQAKIHVSR